MNGMLCCICKEKEATVHCTEIVADKIQKMDLCETCAEKKGLNQPTGISLTDLLLWLDTTQNPKPPGGGEIHP
jgi:protein arginine kinase activator